MDTMRKHILSIFTSAVKSVLPRQLIKDNLKVTNDTLTVSSQLEITLNNNVHVIGFGKATLAMASAVEDSVYNHLVGGVISIPIGTQNSFKLRNQVDCLLRNDSKIEIFEGAANNLPDDNSLKAAKRIVEYLETLGSDDVVLVLISVAVGLETDEELNEKYSKVFTGIKQCVLTYYALEICLKWFYNFFVFWIDLWNVLDFAILIMAISIPRGEFLGGLRLIRVVRYAQEMYALTDLKLLRGMVIVSRGILLSLLPLVDILLMVLLLVIMLSAIAVIVLGEFVPKYYGYFSLALFNLFSTFTNEVWSRIHYVVQNKTGTTMFYILVVFNLAVIFLGTFFVRGLCLATLHSNLELATEQVEAEEKLRAELRLKAQSDKNKKNARPYEKFSSMFATNEAESAPIQRPKVQTIWAEKLFRDKNYSQRQCEITDLSNLSVERVTNYFMLLTALSENFNEYTRIRTDLERLVKVICDLQSSLAESHEKAKGEKVKVESELTDDARAKLLATREELEKRKLLFSKLGDRETVLSQMSTMKDERSEDVRFTFAPYL